MPLDPRPEATRPELSPSQQALLRELPARFPPERIDRLWIFSPRVGKSRETGFIVLSLLPDETGPTEPDRRALVTLRYEADPASRAPRPRDRVTEEGWAPPEQIERVIAGVLARSQTDYSDPIVEAVDGDPDRWADLLTRLGLAA